MMALAYAGYSENLEVNYCLTCVGKLLSLSYSTLATITEYHRLRGL